MKFIKRAKAIPPVVYILATIWVIVLASYALVIFGSRHGENDFLGPILVTALAIALSFFIATKPELHEHPEDEPMQ